MPDPTDDPTAKEALPKDEVRTIDEARTIEEVRTIDELREHCFGCGTRNPSGLRLQFLLSVDEGGAPVATARVSLGMDYEGAPGHLHGGILATLLDEAMSKLSRPLGVLAMTRHLEVDYLRPAPIETMLVVESRTVRREGRKLFQQAEVRLPEGTVLTRGKALFVVLDSTRHALPLAEG